MRSTAAGKNHRTGLRRTSPQLNKWDALPLGGITEQDYEEYQITNPMLIWVPKYRSGRTADSRLDFASIIGAITILATQRERRTIIAQSPRYRHPCDLWIQAVIKCTLTRAHPEYARASTPQGSWKKLGDREPINRENNLFYVLSERNKREEIFGFSSMSDKRIIVRDGLHNGLQLGPILTESYN